VIQPDGWNGATGNVDEFGNSISSPHADPADHR
jgi:hypothetical protein